MTALNFAIYRERAFVACDTSIATPANNVIGMTTKVHALPHLRMLVAATGQHALLAKWVEYLITEPRLRDIEDLDALAPEFLTRLAANLDPKRAGLTDEAQPSSTIYHFGACADDSIIAYRYSSWTGFASERLAPGVYLHPGGLPTGAEIQPGIVVADPAPAAPAAPALTMPWRLQVQSCVSAMRMQHAQQRVPIAGRIQCAELGPFAIQQYWLGELGADPDE